MSSVPELPARPSIFLSYASSDRPAARSIRDVLAKAGLEVWLDEEELAGGEAWDAKIRQQIRTCTYFMPLISTTTDARGEGYFRREWRLAVERNLDMADDVTFLVPVALDATPEHTARVPEKFLAVQWTACPDGRENAALLEVAQRLMTEFVHGHAPRAKTRAERKAEERAARRMPGHHPWPVFPAFPEKDHWARWTYDVMIWAGHMLAALWHRLPRWAQVIVTISLFLKLLDAIFGTGSGGRVNRPDPDRKNPSEMKAPAESSKKS